MRAAFLFFRRPEINGKSKLLFKPPQPQNLLQPAPSPVGEGWGEGIPRISATFPNTLTAQNTSLAACCPLSNSLPRGERTGWLLGLKVLQGKQVVRAAFCFSDDLKSTAVNPSCFSNCLQPQNLLQPAPSPVGEGWGEGISEFRQPSPTP